MTEMKLVEAEAKRGKKRRNKESGERADEAKGGIGWRRKSG